MSQNIEQLEQELNQTVLGGDILGAFEKFYAEDVVMTEGGGDSFSGKDANREREKQFVESVAEFHGAEVRASAVAGDVSFSEWMMDVTFQDGTRKKMEQVAVRRWRDGQVVAERFYYDTAG